MRRQMRLSVVPVWLPLYLVVAIAATLSPFRGAMCERTRGLMPGVSGFDLVTNLLLFAPLGFALRERSRWKLVALAVVLSGSIELAQAWLPRVQSALDIVINAMGALLGATLAPLIPLPSTRVWRSLLLIAAPLALITLAGSAAIRVPLDFSNWEAFPLWLGNEATGDRPWFGILHEVRVYDHAIDVTEPGAEAEPPAWSSGGPVLWIRLGHPIRARLEGPEGVHERKLEPIRQAKEASASGLRFDAPGVELDRELSTHVLERIGSAGRLGIRVLAEPARLDQIGPARMVSFSATTGLRNFMVAQRGGDVVVRVRTPATGLNGSPPEVRTMLSPLRTRPQWIDASFDGELLRIGVDGHCYVEANLALDTAPLPIGRLLAPSIAGTVALSGLAASILAPAARPWLRRGAFIAGAVAGFGTLSLMDIWAHLHGFDVAALALATAASIAALPCLAALAGGAPAQQKRSGSDT